MNADKSVICNIVDIGPWNTDDPYWQTGARPEAESGVDSRGRKTNHAGIDLTPGPARALGVDGKGTVSWEFVNLPVSGPVSDQVTVPTGDSTLGDLAKWLGQLMNTIGTINGGVVPSNLPAQQIPILGGIAKMPTPAPANLDPVLQQVLAILQALGPQITQLQSSAGPASPQDLLVKMIASSMPRRAPPRPREQASPRPRQQARPRSRREAYPCSHRGSCPRSHWGR